MVHYPTWRLLTKSFTDPEDISHVGDDTAATLYEAAAFAVAEFRRDGVFEVHIGPGTRLRGTMSEAKRHVIRARLNGGIRHKAVEEKCAVPVRSFGENGMMKSHLMPNEAVVSAIRNRFRAVRTRSLTGWPLAPLRPIRR
jgi:hypothetical protein